MMPLIGSAVRWAVVWYCMLEGCFMASITNSGWFWHISDIHYDFSFDGGRLSCNGKVEGSAPYSNYWCDSNWRLTVDSFAAMARLEPNVDFLIWTGDNVAHIEDEHLSMELNIHILTNITSLFGQYFPTTTVYAALGNHDYFPTHQFPSSSNVMYNTMGDLWAGWINDTEQVENFKRGAFYTVKTAHGLRLVALNTNLYYTRNKKVRNETDPAGQLAWLRKTLQAADTAGEKVLMISHVGVGVFTPDDVKWMYTGFHKRFVSILREYGHVITGIHFGHQHEDSFKVLKTTDGKPAIPMLFAPSLTPWRFVSATSGFIAPEHNPAIRLVEYDRSTGRQLNIVQFYTNLTSTNLNNRSDWTRAYDFKKAFDVRDVTASSLHELVQRMWRPEGAKYFDRHYKFTTVIADRDDDPTCNTSSCKSAILCGLDNIDYDRYDSCVVEYKKRFQTSGSTPVQLSEVYRLAYGFLLLLVAYTSNCI
ncbi:acid sphingomyelinase-like phosphodiesterase 3b [Gigantopelta aegis]|uniref:acid sphingomyelinase-like phosphodiesterase 3b n=1 Tax=Gigantopelta aegis TaxID=1735272 RepID=UPI001B888798|nr:acid sphingomyelinase-like phosphodiesterase 3b [Gigantopelta aegis]